jgi:hypothetical protein
MQTSCEVVAKTMLGLKYGPAEADSVQRDELRIADPGCCQQSVSNDGGGDKRQFHDVSLRVVGEKLGMTPS